MKEENTKVEVGLIYMIHEIEIFSRSDYNIFFQKYVGDGNSILTRYKGDKFIFQVKFDTEDIDEQLLFDYFLISKQYGLDASFVSEIYLSEIKDDRKKLDTYFALSAYGFFQELNMKTCKVIYADGKRQNFYSGDLKGLKRLVPVFDIDKNTLEFLHRGINRERWEKIKNGKRVSMNKFDSAAYRLCWRLLYSDVGSGNLHLSELRKEAFSDEKFYELIEGIPMIALLIFAMLDYSYREDAVEHYKESIKKCTSLKSITLEKRDFLYEKQSEQNRVNFVANKQLTKEGYDNKTIWSTEGKVIHPFIVKEIYEAITISEGILQLIENIVFHAGKKPDSGTGLLGLYIRNFEKDKHVLHNKYPQYIDFCERESIKSKYYLELLIGDLSGTDISHKFMDNNRDFINRNKEEIERRMLELGDINRVPKTIFLNDFFAPSKSETAFWTAFFSFPDKAINHYGLQIFDSIISSKGGLFAVESGEERYCNVKETGDTSWPKGSRYSIVFPVNGYSSADTNIYDSMFAYDYDMKVDMNANQIKLINGEKVDFSEESGKKNEYIKTVEKLIWDNDAQILCFDVRSFKSTECLIKALLLYIFEKKAKCTEDQLLVALLNSRTYQIINIARILALYYNKQGKNIKMKNVQIYIRGINVGEEILFYGENLTEVKNNIAKCACMRGTMFDSLLTVNKVLERREEKE